MFFAKNEAQTGLVFRSPQEIIHSGKIKVHFAGEFWFKFFDLEVDHDITAQSQVIEQQIEKEILVADLEVILTSDEREKARHSRWKRIVPLLRTFAQQ